MLDPPSVLPPRLSTRQVHPSGLLRTADRRKETGLGEDLEPVSWGGEAWTCCLWAASARPAAHTPSRRPPCLTHLLQTGHGAQAGAQRKTILKLADRKTPKWIILKLKRKTEIFIMFNTSIKTEDTRELYHTSAGEVGGRVVSALTYCSGTVSLTQRLNWRFMPALCLRNERGAIMV